MKFLFAFLLICATVQIDGYAQGNRSANWQALESELLALGYQGLFIDADGQGQEEIWRGGKRTAAFEALILDEGSGLPSRFLAAQVLIKHNWQASKADFLAPIAAAYADALKASVKAEGPYAGLQGDSWGYPFLKSSQVNLTEEMALLGEGMAPYLMDLLDDTRFLPYEGHQESGEAATQEIRVCDIAAVALVQIKQFSWEWSPRAKVRDVSLRLMREHL